MSWHWVGPALARHGVPIILADDRPATPLAQRARCPRPSARRCRRAPCTMLSSSGVDEVRAAGPAPRRRTSPMKAPPARSATAFASAAMSSGVSPCSGGAVRSLKIRGELTIAACSGCASGTLMTSMRNSAEFGSLSGAAFTHPGSSLGDRTPTSRRCRRRRCRESFGSTSTVCVCEPRQVCTLPTFFGCAMSLMSKMRMPRSRSLLTVSCTPSRAAVERPVEPLARDEEQIPVDRDVALRRRADVRRLRARGLAGFEMSQTW